MWANCRRKPIVPNEYAGCKFSHGVQILSYNYEDIYKYPNNYPFHRIASGSYPYTIPHSMDTIHQVQATEKNPMVKGKEGKKNTKW
jgi:hypothetical protein